MVVRNAGSASIRIKPDAGDFPKELRAQLKSIPDPGFTIDVSADVGQAKADIRRFREVEQQNGMRLGVDVALGQAQADMAAFRARQRADGLTIKVDADTGKARTNLASLRREVDGFGRADLRLNLGALGIAAVQPAVTGLAQVAAGLQQVAQAGLVVPGAIAGAAASIGTLALGLSGVKDAYDAVSKASASAGQDQAAQARAASQASNQLRNAVVDETQARKDQARAYRDARQQLTDLNVEMRGGLISESRAVLEAQKAREDLAKGNFSDIRDAQLRVLEADQRVIEVRSRNTQVATQLNDAQAKGVEGSDLVVAANERVVRAQQQVADAQAAVADTATKTSAAQSAAAQAMDKLSPSARKFVQTLIDMRPAFDEVRDAAQEPLFEGKDEEFRNFFTNVAPNIKQGLSGIATAWNQNITALLTSLGSDQGKSIIDRILGNTGEAQSRLSAAIDPLVRGIGTLAAAGTDALPRLADALGSVATRFSDFIEEADKDGRLDRWINDGLTGMTSLGNSVINIGKVFTGITQAAGGGGSFLQWLENLTSKWQTFVNSQEGQSKLREYFQEGLDLLRQWGDLLKELPGAFQSMADGAQPYVGTLISLFQSLASLIGDHPELVKTAITAYLAWKTISPIISGVQGAMGALSTVVTNLGTNFAPVRDKAKAAMKEVDDVFTAAGRQGSGVGKFAGAVRGLSVAGGPLALLVTAGLPLVAMFVEKVRSDMDDAAEHINAVDSAAKNLIGTLENVTNLTGQATRNRVAQSLQSGQLEGGAGKGLGGDVLAAARALGIGGPDQRDLVSAALPGGQAQYDDIMKPLREGARPAVQDFIRNQGLRPGEGKLAGISEDTIIDAWLGVPSALEKVQSAKELGQNMIDLGTLYDQVNRLGSNNPIFQSSLIGQRLNLERSGASGAVQQAQAAQAASVPQPRLKGNYALLFPGAVVNSDGSTVTIVTDRPPAPDMALGEGTKAEQGVPPNQNKWTYRLSPEDARRLTFEKGGPTPSGRGPGPTGGWLAEVHGDEWVLPKAARAAVGDDALWALTKGTKMELGGPGEDYLHSPENTNPALNNPAAPTSAPPAISSGIGTGPAPGPVAPIAPNPMAGSGGLTSIIGGVTQGIQGPISNAISLGNGLLDKGQQQSGGGLLPALGPMDPASVATRASQVPGLIGLWGSMNSANPDLAVQNWNTKTTKWMADWSTKLVGGLTSALWDGGGNGGGLLGFFGLQNSILSSSNPYNRAATQGAQFALGQDGPVGQLLGINGSGSTTGTGGLTDPTALSQQYGVTLDDATLAQLYAGNGDSSLLQNMSPAAQRAIQYAQTHAVGQAYQYGGAGQTGGYDCSGIASAIYAAATGQPPGRYFDTESDFEALGFVPGFKPGALNIGVSRNGGGRNSHMAVTLPNMVNVESGGAHDTTAYGGPAAGAKSFPLQWYLPLPEGFRDGGPTPSRKGPGPTGGFFAEVHPDEFMISARGRSTVPDSFLHALNQGLVDPKDLPGFAVGGDPAAALVVPPPRPNFDPGQGIKPQIVPPARVPAQARPAPAPSPAPAPAAPAESEPAAPPTTTAGTPAQQQPTIGVPQGVAPAPSSIDHNLGWVNQAISSGASTLGNLVSSAISMGAAAGGGGAGGGMGAGLASSLVSGLFQQSGKVVTDAANVVSSFLVGNVPGSYGDPNMPAYGRVNMPAQNRPATAPYRGGNTYMISGHDTADVLQEANNNEALERQGILATRRG